MRSVRQHRGLAMQPHHNRVLHERPVFALAHHSATGGDNGGLPGHQLLTQEPGMQSISRDTHTYTDAHEETHALTCNCKHTHTHTHARTHARTHAHTHTLATAIGLMTSLTDREARLQAHSTSRRIKVHLHARTRTCTRMTAGSHLHRAIPA